MQGTRGATTLNAHAQHCNYIKNARRRAERRIELVKMRLAQTPWNKEEGKILDAAIAWLGENAALMDEAQRTAAFFAVAGHATACNAFIDPLGAGFALCQLADDGFGLKNALEVRGKLMRRIWSVTDTEKHCQITFEMHYLVLLAAGMGEPNAVRLLVFWERMGMISGVMERIETAHPGILESLKKDMEAGARASVGR